MSGSQLDRDAVGQVQLKLKTPWLHGTVHLVL